MCFYSLDLARSFYLLFTAFALWFFVRLISIISCCYRCCFSLFSFRSDLVIYLFFVISLNFIKISLFCFAFCFRWKNYELVNCMRAHYTSNYYGIKSRKWCVLILAAHSWFAFLSQFIDDDDDAAATILLYNVHI